jgi:hypothetical protein
MTIRNINIKFPVTILNSGTLLNAPMQIACLLSRGYVRQNNNNNNNNNNNII